MRPFYRFPTLLLFALFSCHGQQSAQEVFETELGPTKAAALNALIKSYEQYLESNYEDEKSLGERTRKYLMNIRDLKDPGALDSLKAISVLNVMEKSGLRKDIYLYEYEMESNTHKYDIEQFLPTWEPGADDLNLGELSDFEDNFTEVSDTVELTEEEQLARVERGKRRVERERSLDDYLRRKPYINENGLYLYALAKAMKSDPSFMEYVELRNMSIDLSPTLLADSYLKNINVKESEMWHNKIPLVIDLYYFGLLHKYVVNKN